MADTSRYKEIPGNGALIYLTETDVEYLQKMKPILDRLWSNPAEVAMFVSDSAYATKVLSDAKIIGDDVEIIAHQDGTNPNTGKKQFHLCIPLLRGTGPGEAPHELLMKLCSHMLRSCADGC